MSTVSKTKWAGSPVSEGGGQGPISPWRCYGVVTELVGHLMFKLLWTDAGTDISDSNWLWSIIPFPISPAESRSPQFLSRVALLALMSVILLGFSALLHVSHHATTIVQA